MRLRPRSRKTRARWTMTGALTVDAGSVSLNEANTIGSVAVSGGTLAFGNGGALGAGDVSLSGGELLATANETLSNALSFSGSSTIAAAHGTTLNETGVGLTSPRSSTLNFGAPGQDGPSSGLAGGYAHQSCPSQPSTLRPARSKRQREWRARRPPRASQPTHGRRRRNARYSRGLALSSPICRAAARSSTAAPQTTLTLDAANFSGAISGPQSLVANGRRDPERKQYLYRDHYDQFGR